MDLRVSLHSAIIILKEKTKVKDFFHRIVKGMGNFSQILYKLGVFSRGILCYNMLNYVEMISLPGLCPISRYRANARYPMTAALRGRQSQKEVSIPMRYDEYDDYNSRDRRDGRSRSSSYDRSASGRRDSYQSSYDRDRRSSSRSSYDRDRSSGYQSGYDRGYDDRYGSRYSSSGYDRRYDQSYDRYGGRTRGGFDNFDEENWRRTAPNWVDHSDPDPAPRRRSSSGSDRRRNADYDRRDSGSYRSRSSSRRNDGRRYDDRRRSDSRGRDRRQSVRRSGVSIVPIILLVIVAILAVFLVKTLLGGGGNDQYTISFSTQNIVLGDTAEATLNGLENPADTEVVWSSGDNNVVSVSGDGVVCTLTAKSTGKATIAATIDGETVASGSVMVVDSAPGVEDIRLSEEQVTVEAGSQYTIQATVVMEKDDMDPAKIRWTSSDSDIAKVSDNGVIEGRQVGQAIIKGTAGEKTAELVVNVTENTSNTQYDETGNVGQEPEEGVTIPEEADTTVDPNNSETSGEVLPD